MHLDRGYDSGKTRDLLEVLGFAGETQVGGRAYVAMKHPATSTRVPQLTDGLDTESGA